MDYVLCYKYKKRRGSKPRLSITSNGSINIQMLARLETEGESAEANAPVGDVEDSKLTEEEKALMREEFEAGLLEAGLQIERDKEVRFDFAFDTPVALPSLAHGNRPFWVRAIFK